jgi:hypothetical protein
MNSVGLLSAQGLAIVHGPRAQNGSTGPCHWLRVGAPTGGHRAPGARGGTVGVGSLEAGLG